jgi:hypothetical protein
MEGVISGTRQGKVTLQTDNDWESMAIENKTKATLHDELIKQLPMEMGELLEEARLECRKWHFKQTRKYTNALDVAYQCIQQLEKKTKKKKIQRRVLMKKQYKKMKSKSLYKNKDEDETTHVGKLIRK